MALQLLWIHNLLRIIFKLEFSSHNFLIPSYYISPFAIIDQKKVLFWEERAFKFNTELTWLNRKRIENNREGLIGPLLEWKVEPTKC